MIKRNNPFLAEEREYNLEGRAFLSGNEIPLTGESKWTKNEDNWTEEMTLHLEISGNPVRSDICIYI